MWDLAGSSIRTRRCLSVFPGLDPPIGILRPMDLHWQSMKNLFHFLELHCWRIFIRKYIPSLVTSVICLPVSIVILVRCADYITFDVKTDLCILIGIVVMAMNLKLAHMLMHWFNRIPKQPASEV